MQAEGSLPCSQEPARRPVYHFVTSFFFYGEELLAPSPSLQAWGTTPCRLSATAYSIYSHLSVLEATMRIVRHTQKKEPLGKRPLGRPRRRWEDNINNSVRAITASTRSLPNGLARWQRVWSPFGRHPIGIPAETRLLWCESVRWVLEQHFKTVLQTPSAAPF
jgi:hypothetical protein